MQKILIVDDSPTVIAVLQIHLEKAGYTVATHTRGLGALVAVLKERPDVILLDVALPSLSGDEICKLIKKDDATSRALILFHSSLNEEALQRKVKDAGADGYVHKSWGPERITESIKSALE